MDVCDVALSRDVLLACKNLHEFPNLQKLLAKLKQTFVVGAGVGHVIVE